MKIIPAYGTMIDHDELSDLRRQDDNVQYRADNEKLFAKWLLPPKSEVNDFSPTQPCTCRGLREVSEPRHAVAA